MKVAVLSTPIFPLGDTGLAGYGGLEQIAWLCAKGLAARGHRVTLYAPEGSSCPGAEVHSIGPARSADERRAFDGYGDSLAGHDVVIDHTWQKWAYIAKARGLKPPVLGVMHAPVDTMYRTLPPGVERPCFVCISKDQAAHFEALHGKPARHCWNGIDPDFYQPVGAPRTNRFLFLARFSSIKGADLAIEACLAAGVGLDLVGDTTITGEPDYLQKCLDMARRSSPGWDLYKNGPQVVVRGGCPRGETVWWYSRAHAMLHPNRRFREPFGLAPVEAMACGCPVIAWDFGAMRETIGPNRTGWLVKSFGELVTSINNIKNDQIGSAMRAACRKQALDFTIDRMVLRYEELCSEALTTGGW